MCCTEQQLGWIENKQRGANHYLCVDQVDLPKA